MEHELLHHVMQVSLKIEQYCLKTYNINKAIVDYISPPLCTPVTPFPPISDATYRQHAVALISLYRRRSVFLHLLSAVCGCPHSKYLLLLLY